VLIYSAPWGRCPWRSVYFAIFSRSLLRTVRVQALLPMDGRIRPPFVFPELTRSYVAASVSSRPRGSSACCGVVDLCGDVPWIFQSGNLSSEVRTMAPRLFRWLGPGGQDGSSLQGCSRAYFFTSGNAIETFPIWVYMKRRRL
jgi:hypothetical protein